MPTRKLTEQQQMTDHDLLTTLVATSNAHQQNVLQAIGELKEQVKSVQETQDGQNTAILTRVSSLETYRATHLNPEAYQRWNKTAEEWESFRHDLKNRWKLLLGAWSIAQWLFGAAIATVYYWIQLHK